jgi:hypothetical protein
MARNDAQDSGLPLRRVGVGDRLDFVRFSARIRRNSRRTFSIDFGAGVGGVGRDVGDMSGRGHGLMIVHGGCPVRTLDGAGKLEGLNLASGVLDVLDKLARRVSEIAKPVTAHRLGTVQLVVLLVLLLGLVYELIDRRHRHPSPRYLALRFRSRIANNIPRIVNANSRQFSRGSTTHIKVKRNAEFVS